MIINIYFGEKPVFLCDELNPDLQEILHHPDAVFIDEISSHALKSLMHEIRKPEFHAGVVLSNDLPALKKMFWKMFTVIKAGGGFVLNEKKELLMIFRRGFWDLPKGKLDPGEKIEDCAVREVKEETGLKTVKRGELIVTTYHIYDEFGKHVLKESWWYGMKANSEEPLIAQTEEDITQIGWMKYDDVLKILPNAYPSIREVVKVAGTFNV